MDLQIGSVVTGKVTGIAKFGAFVEIAPGQSGLIHISEIADAYVNEVRDHLTEGQQVQVKIVGIEGKKINLSIKAAASPAQQPDTAPAHERLPARTYQPRAQAVAENDAEPSFEDRLKRFMKDSDSKMSEMRRSSDRRSGTRRRGR
ncbi:MAG: S1 RNA-binding domain-containing protein [Clostridiales bacterium]|nr:S1 RNA-binding domain-containing protein [Clostridiales bacterium]